MHFTSRYLFGEGETKVRLSHFIIMQEKQYVSQEILSILIAIHFNLDINMTYIVIIIKKLITRINYRSIYPKIRCVIQ